MGIVDPGAQMGPEIEPSRGEQAGVHLSVCRQSCPSAAATERIRDGTDHTDLTHAIAIAVTLGDFARVLRRNCLEGKHRRDGVDDGLG